MESSNIKKMVMAAIVGSAYAALTISMAPIAYGPLQMRLSEVLCILPFFMPGTAWGLAVGCAIANMFGGYGILDIVFGSLATLCSGLLMSRIKTKWLACLQPVLWNGVVVGALIAYVATPGAFLQGFFVNAAQIAVAEAVIMFGIGLPLMSYLPKVRGMARFIER